MTNSFSSSTQKSIKNSFDGDSSSQFIEFAHKIASYAYQAGCTVTPFHQTDVPYFNSQSSEKKLEILAAMKVFVEICQLTLANDKRLNDTKALTWYALKHLNMRFTSDLFDKISDDDILEVYTYDNIQVFRNFKFLDLISYTIEDIFCRPWPELFVRHDLQKLSDVLAVIRKMATRQINETVSLEYLGAHQISEAHSALRYKYNYIVKHLSPLYDKDHHPIGYLFIESASIISPLMTDQEKEKLLNKFYDPTMLNDRAQI